MSLFQLSVKVVLLQIIDISTALKLSLTLFEIQFKSNKNLMTLQNLHTNKTGQSSSTFHPE